MKRLALLLLCLLVGCPVSDPPASVNRGAGVEAVSSVTVLTIPVVGSDTATPGTNVQRTIVAWLKANPEAKILQMESVGNNGYSHEIVLIVEGKLGSP